ncbi:MAG: hypothetical protein KDJ88_10435 [Bauldia sp.]|nr:hypothetical protein [Bauldia sp.]
MTIFLHIGSHKTGTTAVQRFAASHRAVLRGRGLWYPSYEEIGLSGHYAHHHFAHAIADVARGRFGIEDATRFAEAVRRGRKKGEIVLISAEPIYRHVLKGPDDYWARRDAYIARLRDVLGADGVTVLAVFRRQDGFARSLYQEKIKSRKYAARFRQFLVEQRHEFEYHRQLSVFARVFDTVDLLVYEDLRQRGLIDAFFAHLGVDVSDLDRGPAENRSLPIELVEYKRLLNATKAGKDKLEHVADLLDKRAAKGGLVDHVDWISRQDMETFCASFAAENEMLRRDFASDHPAPLFPSLEASPIADLDEYEGMSVHRFAELTAEILL